MRIASKWILGITVVSLAVFLCMTVGLPVVQGSADHIRWDIIHLNTATTPPATGFAILAIAGTLMNVTPNALAGPDTFTTIDFPGASTTRVSGINPQGDIVGQYNSAGVTHGFLLSGDTFTTIDFPGASLTTARDINPQGDIVGEYISAGVTHGFLLSGNTFTTIDFPGASLTQPFEINPRGEIVGQYISGGVTHGFLFRP
jgi:hypothetical protein